MTKNLGACTGLLQGTFVLVVGSLIGFSVYLIMASAVGLISPIWWGGEALLFPVVFGVTVLVAGGVVLCLILQCMVSTLGRKLTSSGQIVGGVIIGALLMPIQMWIASWLTAIPGWDAMAPMTSVFVVLAVAAICSAIVASLVIAFFPSGSNASRTN